MLGNKGMVFSSLLVIVLLLQGGLAEEIVEIAFEVDSEVEYYVDKDNNRREDEDHADKIIPKDNDKEESVMKKDLLLALDSTARHSPVPVGKRVAVGWNSNVDMIVNGYDITKAHPLPLPRDVDTIMTMEDFFASFAHWFEKGAAAERFVESELLFEEIITLARAQSRRVEYNTGGNAALMATALAGENCQCDVLLGGLVGPQLESLLSSSIRTVHVQDNAGSLDAIHLILEYGEGDTWGNLTSPRHNRFIVVHDPYNAKLEGLEPLSDQMKSEVVPYQVFIASGLNQLEGLPPLLRNQRVSAVVSFLRQIHRDTPVHLELASVADKSFLLSMFERLSVHANSMGLNEEELAMLYDVLGGTFSETTFTREMLTGRVPDAGAVSRALEFVFHKVSMLRIDASDRELTRVHFHSLSFHIIARRKSSKEHHWSPSSASAAAQGAIAAVSQACGIPLSDLNDTTIDFLSPLHFTSPSSQNVHISSDQPVAEWSSESCSFYFVPVPVCKKPKNTVGLGDAISATALAYSLK